MKNYDGMINKEITKGKYIFWDIDGTLAPYRFNNHVGIKNSIANGMSEKEVNDGCFLYRQPSKHMQKVMSTAKAKKNIIMGHYCYQKEKDDKLIWLKKYFPLVDEVLLTYDDKPKYKSILNYCNKNKIDVNDIIFVDDIIPFLREAEKNHIPSWHVSSFFDWE